MVLGPKGAYRSVHPVQRCHSHDFSPDLERLCSYEFEDTDHIDKHGSLESKVSVTVELNEETCLKNSLSKWQYNISVDGYRNESYGKVVDSSFVFTRDLMFILELRDKTIKQWFIRFNL